MKQLNSYVNSSIILLCLKHEKNISWHCVFKISYEQSWHAYSCIFTHCNLQNYIKPGNNYHIISGGVYNNKLHMMSESYFDSWIKIKHDQSVLTNKIKQEFTAIYFTLI